MLFNMTLREKMRLERRSIKRVSTGEKLSTSYTHRVRSGILVEYTKFLF